MSTNIDNLPSDGARVDLRTGWERQTDELSLAVRWVSGEPVAKGTVHVKGNAGRSRSFLFTDGVVRLAPLASTSYTIEVSAEGAQSITLENFHLDQENAPLEVTLIPD